jgi:hypothetical protein
MVAVSFEINKLKLIRHSSLDLASYNLSALSYLFQPSVIDYHIYESGGVNSVFLINYNNTDVGFVYISYYECRLSIESVVFYPEVESSVKRKAHKSLLDIALEVYPDAISLQLKFFLESTSDQEIMFDALPYFESFDSEYRYYVNLDNDLDKIKSDLRKSYRNLINKSLKTFTFKLYDASNTSDDVWASFKALHVSQAGKVTRSDDSWDLQHNIIKEDNGFLVCAYLEKALVGCSFCAFSDVDSVYGSAAYDRDLFHLPLGHGCQWEAIKYLKQRGVCKYFLGAAASDNLDKKVSNIEVFKRGFTSAVLPVHVFKKVLMQ